MYFIKDKILYEILHKYKYLDFLFVDMNIVRMIVRFGKIYI